MTSHHHHQRRPTHAMRARISCARFWLAALAASSVSCTMSATAPPPNPNLTVADRSHSSVILDGVAAPVGKVCSHHAGLTDFCVTDFQSALSYGLHQVLSRHFDPPSGDTPMLHARFELVEFSHSPGSAPGPHNAAGVQVAMRWHFVLLRPDGTPVVDVAERTIGPEELIDINAAQSTIGALDNAVLERISKALTDAREKSQRHAEAPGPPKPPPQACVPGSTQECVGPGGCRGGQACNAEGTGYSPCDCGTPDGGAT